jgi:hypothetical protein
MTQYIKFAGDSLKRLEEEEVTTNNQELIEQEVDLNVNPHMVWKGKLCFL